MGRYEVVLPLASGGMATVYLARVYGAGGFGREVALKLMHAHLRDAPEFAQSLLDEARLMVSIRHPNVVSVLDVGDDPRGLFLVMDFIEGETIGGLQKRALKEGRPVPPAVKARLLLDALAGLHAAHESRAEDGTSLDLIHRDFSPQNLLVGTDGVTRLTDFGVAKAATQLQRTQTGIVKGKASYMAPEQARGLPLDRRADLWAAGVVAWELLAARRLFSADSDVAALVRVLSESAPRLDLEVGAPRAVADAVERALQPQVADRWATAGAFRQALLEAFRSADGVAEHEEVAAFVTSLLGERLAARREQAAAVLRERRRPTAVEQAGLQEPTSDPQLAATDLAVVATPVPSLTVPPVTAAPDSAPVTAAPSSALVTRPDEPAPRRSWTWRHPAAVVTALVLLGLAGYRLRADGGGSEGSGLGGSRAVGGAGALASSSSGAPVAAPEVPGSMASAGATMPEAPGSERSVRGAVAPVVTASGGRSALVTTGGTPPGRKQVPTLAPSPYGSGAAR